MLKNKKGQLSLEDAPQVVLVVGLVFLIMATMAFIGTKYGDAIIETTTDTNVNETGFLNSSGYTLAGSTDFRATGFTAITVLNRTNGAVLGAGNYSISGSAIYNASAIVYNNVSITYSYTTSVKSAAFNVTEDLNTEVANNTSIAGIILTISLVGIVLAILVGVFLVARMSPRA
jgi:hypothetical protein